MTLTNEAAASDTLQDFPDGSSGPRSSSCSSSVVDDGGISMGLAVTVLSDSSIIFSLSNDASDTLYRAGADARVVDELEDSNVIFCSMLEVADSLVFNDADCCAFLFSVAFLVNYSVT
jgi:hypothetical protein